jgi:hypothetical protein
MARTAMSSVWLCLSLRLRRFCSETSLHGWRYLPESNWVGATFFALVLAALNATALFFIYSNAAEYLRSTVSTTVDTSSGSLRDVYFPAVTVCNMNQVDALELVIRRESS